jgi:hypothetical protein
MGILARKWLLSFPQPYFNSGITGDSNQQKPLPSKEKNTNIFFIVIIQHEKTKGQLVFLLSGIKEYQKEGKSVLELVNTLSYVFPVNHDILDKCETAKNVINDDIADYNSSRKYDLIVSVFCLPCVWRLKLLKNRI